MSAVLLPRLKKQIFFKTYCSCCRGKWVKERMVYLWLLKHFHRNNILLLHSHFMGPGTSYDQVSRWAREINFADRKSLQVTWGVEMCYSSTVQSKTYHIRASFKSHLTYENKHFSGPLTSGTVSASFCSVGLMLLWRSDIRRLWLRWAIKSRWSLHNPWVSHCALFLGTRVIIINGRVIGWANMQVFRGDLQSSILSKEIQPPSRATQRHPDWLLFMNTVLIPRVIVLIWLMKWWC